MEIVSNIRPIGRVTDKEVSRIVEGWDNQIKVTVGLIIRTFRALTNLFWASNLARNCLLRSIPWYCLGFTYMGSFSANSKGKGILADVPPPAIWGWNCFIYNWSDKPTKLILFYIKENQVSYLMDRCLKICGYPCAICGLTWAQWNPREKIRCVNNTGQFIQVQTAATI